jgi:hypothetical protein
MNIKCRIIIIENSIVVAESTKLDEDSAFAFTDPNCMFAVGDVFSAERYEILYGVNPYSPPFNLDSVYIFPVIKNTKAIFAAGLQTNIQPHKKSKYVYLTAESDDFLSEVNAYSKHHNVKTPNYTLTNKEVVTQKYIDAGFLTLTTVPVCIREDIVLFPFERVILKPFTSTNGKAIRHPLENALYKIRTKTEMLDILDGLNAFSDPSIFASNPIIVQQVADGDGDNFEALILSGAVNGAGDVWHFAPINLYQQYTDTERNAKTVWSPENNTAETAQLQQRVELLLAAAGSVNCFYQLQFLRSNGAWVPHDFQYRMNYYVNFGLEELGFIQHKTDVIKFAFDQSTQTPEQPKSFGLKLFAPRLGIDKKQFVEGASKAEVLANLELL